MEGLMKMCRSTRNNDYFKKMAHRQIDVGFRILEYLEPDAYFPPKNLSSSTMDKFLRQDVEGAVTDIMNEICYDGEDYGIEPEAVEFAKEVLKDCLAKKKKEKLSEREQLLIRLGELDAELS